MFLFTLSAEHLSDNLPFFIHREFCEWVQPKFSWKRSNVYGYNVLLIPNSFPSNKQRSYNSNSPELKNINKIKNWAVVCQCYPSVYVRQNSWHIALIQRRLIIFENDMDNFRCLETTTPRRWVFSSTATNPGFSWSNSSHTFGLHRCFTLKKHKGYLSFPRNFNETLLSLFYSVLLTQQNTSSGPHENHTGRSNR